jgi:hypothetical protein
MARTTSESLQQTRFTIVHVDPAAGRLRLKGEADACTDLGCGEQTLVLAEDGTAGLQALNAGDIVRVDVRAGRAERVTVVRRVWDELTSPEF